MPLVIMRGQWKSGSGGQIRVDKQVSRNNALLEVQT